MGLRSVRAGELAEQLAGADPDNPTVRAVVDPAAVMANLPCVLIPPPRLTFDVALPHATAEWRLVALVAGPGGKDAWNALDELVALVADVFPLESAEPSSYVISAEQAPLPAYVLTYRETV